MSEMVAALHILHLPTSTHLQSSVGLFNADITESHALPICIDLWDFVYISVKARSIYVMPFRFGSIQAVLLLHEIFSDIHHTTTQSFEMVCLDN
jgi:hypothetical protein